MLRLCVAICFLLPSLVLANIYNPTRAERLQHGFRQRIRKWWRERDLRRVKSVQL